MLDHNKERGQWADGSYEPSPGTIIFFDWEGDGVTDHTGIVQKCENGTVYTVEGNTSNGVAVISNGGMVCKKKYLRTNVKIDGYGR